MKKKELKKRIEDGFSELTPDLFETIMEEAEKQRPVWLEAEKERLAGQELEGMKDLQPRKESLRENKRQSSGRGKIFTGRLPAYALSLCAGLAMICFCILGILGEQEKSVFMILDINPSIQIEMNEARQVKRLKGLNEDGKDIVKELKWKKKEPVQELLDMIIQDVVDKSYLCENGGILVTLSAANKDVCDKLERTLEEGIGRKLTELKVSGVTTAFRQTQGRSEKEGRKLLEAELAKSCGLKEEQVEQMSVMELIRYCQDYTSLELKVSGTSANVEEAQQKSEDKTQTPKDPLSEKETGQSSKENTNKETEDSGKTASEEVGEEKTETEQQEQEEEQNTSQEKLGKGKETSPGGSSQNQGGGNAQNTGGGNSQNQGSVPAGSEKPGKSESSGPAETGNDPAKPEKPEDSEDPELGNDPVNPDNPNQPDSEDESETPEDSEQESDPVKPEKPNSPDTGNTPIKPETPEDPEQESDPVKPEKPNSPDAGNDPVKPEKPDSPDAGNDPVKPEKPNSPNIGNGPAEPAAPESSKLENGSVKPEKSDGSELGNKPAAYGGKRVVVGI